MLLFTFSNDCISLTKGSSTLSIPKESMTDVLTKAKSCIEETFDLILGLILPNRK